MEPISVRLNASLAVSQAIDMIRPYADSSEVVYAYVVDVEDRLTGVIAMRDLLFAAPTDRIGDVGHRTILFYR